MNNLGETNYKTYNFQNNCKTDCIFSPVLLSSRCSHCSSRTSPLLISVNFMLGWVPAKGTSTFK